VGNRSGAAFSGVATSPHCIPFSSRESIRGDEFPGRISAASRVRPPAFSLPQAKLFGRTRPISLALHVSTGSGLKHLARRLSAKPVSLLCGQRQTIATDARAKQPEPAIFALVFHRLLFSGYGDTLLKTPPIDPSVHANLNRSALKKRSGCFPFPPLNQIPIFFSVVYDLRIQGVYGVFFFVFFFLAQNKKKV